MGHSLAHGVTVLRDQRNPETIVVALGDMPFISPGITRAVAERVSPQHTIVAAGTSGGQRGHPVAFWHCHFDALQSLRGDQGAGKLLRNHSPLLIDADNNSVIQDIDKPEDLPGACQ
jgi:molybdenum cofactor cytidylyltransferase